jgi:hypothetical protein
MKREVGFGERMKRFYLAWVPVVLVFAPTPTRARRSSRSVVVRSELLRIEAARVFLKHYAVRRSWTPALVFKGRPQSAAMNALR